MCTDCHLTYNKQKCKKTFYVSVTVGMYLSWYTHQVSITWHITITYAALQHILSTLPIAALGVFNSNSTSMCTLCATKIEHQKFYKSKTDSKSAIKIPIIHDFCVCLCAATLCHPLITNIRSQYLLRHQHVCPIQRQTRIKVH